MDILGDFAPELLLLLLGSIIGGARCVGAE